MPSNLALFRCAAKIKTMNKLAIGSFVVIIAAAVLGVVGVATTFWIDLPLGIHSGLFEACSGFGCSKLDSENQADWWRSVQALVLIGVLCLCVALVLSPFYFCQIWGGCPLSEGTMALATLILTTAAAVCLFIGVIIFGDKAVNDVENLGYSYWLTVIAAALSLLLAVMSCVMKKKGISPS